MKVQLALSPQKKDWTQGNIALEFIDTALRGCAQVMFQNNPVTGIFFFAAIFIGAYAEHNPAVAWGCLLGTVVSTLTGYLVMPDYKTLRAGLYGYNGCLVGATIPTFLITTHAVWGCIVLGGIVSVIASACIADVLKTWKVAPLTAPFVFTSWIILLGSYAFSQLPGIGLPAPLLPHQINVHDIPVILGGHSYLPDIFDGVSEVFLLSNILCGILFLIGLAIESLWAAVFALIGSALAIVTATFLGAETHSIAMGMYSFCAVLTAIALGSAFNKPTWPVLIYTIIGVVFTVVTQGALNTLLEPLGIPTLTMPFVLVTWLFLIPKKLF